MEKFYRAQAGKLLLLTIFSMCTPFMPSIMRSFYLYFLLNLLILVLAMEAGVLASPSSTDEVPSDADGMKSTKNTVHAPAAVVSTKLEHSRPLPMRKFPSTPSLFTIADFDEVVDGYHDDGDDEGDEDDDAQELFARAETFITNFHKQLKMQRDDSWKKIHGRSMSK
ncbi:hypothetical protein ZOSMA_452G00180 [Zostera marina]|uniref:DUF4408 domain-containing protein n=1 Tax=Zostera marina TaxID=29655 RepID=A0A0K9P0S1_ZOSMR|nr:hypothetical protein ZOSMA_452G00180 [Zostera marina]